MPNLRDILSGALGGEYSMGRPLDDEERRRIEELRAQGVYVPQERKMSPFSYGAGTVNKQNLGEMRAAMQPEQKRVMNELMVQRGRGARNAMAMEQQQQQMANNNAIREASRARAIQDQGRTRELGSKPTSSAGSRYANQEGDSMIFRSEEDYAAERPQRTPQEQDELAVLQREALPGRIQEQSLKTQVQAGRTQDLAHEVGLLNFSEQKAASQLASSVRESLPQNYAQTLADKQVVSTELAALIDAQRLRTQIKYGDQLADKSVSKQVNALDLELKSIQDAMDWLRKTEIGNNYSRQGGKLGVDYLNELKKLEAMLQESKAKEDYYNRGGKALTGSPSGSPMQDALDALGGQTSVPFAPNAEASAGTY